MNVADQMGTLSAEISVLQEKFKSLRTKAIDTGEKEIEGSLFRITINVSDREKVDWKSIVERLEPSRQLITANTSHNETTTVRVVARSRA
jgi:hypothetical protein